MTVKIGQKKTNTILMKVNTMAEMMASGTMPEYLFWVGCAGSFDQRAQKITRAFSLILDKVGISYAILGKEEACTGDPARRAGNEFLFQMMAYQNIQVMNAYGVKKIITTCPQKRIPRARWKLRSHPSHHFTSIINQRRKNYIKRRRCV
jgi:Fe-S oxidoreductase